MKEKKIFLVEDENKNIIWGYDVKETYNSDQIVYEEDIEKLVSMEMDENCHDDFMEDYNSKLEYYLSSVERDSFVSHLLPEILDTVKLTEGTRYIIQEEVIKRITERCE